MEKYDFTMQHLYGEKHHHITKILDILQAANLEEIFVRKFYATIPMLNLTEKDYKLYVDLVKNAFKFFSQRKNSENKIKIYQSESKKIGDDHTVIEILTNEMPFIFDSIMLLLSKLNIDIERVAHPTIFTTRDEKGNLLSIEEDNAGDNKQELLIQIRTTHALSEATIEYIKEKLEKIISFVDKAVGDWKKIVNELKEYIEIFNSYTFANNQVYQEQKEFLERMHEKYFVFLGSIDVDIKPNENRELVKNSAFGIIEFEQEEYKDLFDKVIFTKGFCEDKNELISVGKLNKTSIIHRDVNMDYLSLKELDKDGNITKIKIFIGLFTSILYYQSVTLIPIIRGKLNKILEKANVTNTSFTGKELISIAEALPRDELFQVSTENLYSLIMEIYALLFVPELRLFLRKQGNMLSCLLFIPTEIANLENVRKLKSALSFEYGNIVSQYFNQISHSGLCYYHFIIDSKDLKNYLEEEFKQVELELKNLVKPWKDHLYNLLLTEYGKNQGRELFSKFKEAFPLSYEVENKYCNAILEDIENSLSVIKDSKIIFKIVPELEGKSNISLFKIYHIEELNLSSIMPMLQNMGFNVISEQIYVLEPECAFEGVIYLHQFMLKVDAEEMKKLSLAKENIENAFSAMWEEKCQNDIYNQLILKANLTHRQVTLLRALAEYLYQVKIGYSKEYLGQVLNKHFELVKQLVSLFYHMFDPKISSEERKKKVSEIEGSLESLLTSIHDNIEDQLIRRFIDLVKNILRTNYFTHNAKGEIKDFISFKINSSEIEDIPLPRPYREIFVYSASFEAIHLRGGKVSRGGLRWSDRLEDYRTEVLGLMKTQVVKNSVIVPTGAKGGFVVKNTANLSRDELHAKAVECYKNFLRGLLDITDNIVEGKVVHPKNVVRYDSSDSYLVVAADKGTATFSDIANQISGEYNFWLGDAFASGGSKGYDHKKMAITARGAWISVMRHFYEMGIDIKKTDFTVVGIGDMSGDVFGNGMLLSDHIKLVGAFNHMHIFVDPNPDPKKSFIERQRLFNLPRSTWLDYNTEVLSTGARIYDRKAKSLTLTPEIKARFNLEKDNITPEELIKVLLRAEVDLLWNGGIGTYVKASFETHEQVGDKANDNVRCNGSELRCKIIGEGGNLGLTQYGRIEYARIGGRLNTDAIDNSAGVDCSDHEVNIKITLNQALSAGLITEEERVSLLEEMTEDVAELVLKDNRTQTQALTIAEQQGYEILSSQEHFIDILEESGILDRKLENLPSKQQFIQLHSSKTALTRPELSVLLAYSKNAIYNQLIETSISEEAYFYNDLLLYFPEVMREKFAEVISKHPLRKEIITTSITNSMVNRIDTFYLHLTVESTGHRFCDIARAYTITRDVFNLRGLWKEINTLEDKVSVSDRVKLYIEIKKFVTRSTSWLLRNYHGKLDIASAINEYQGKAKELYNIILDCATGKFKENYNTKLNEFLKVKIPKDIAERVAILNLMTSAYNIIEVSNKNKTDMRQVASIYFELGHRFSIDWLRYMASTLGAENNWQKLALKSFKDELYDLNRKMTASAVESYEKSDGNLQKWYKHNEKHIRLYDKFIAEVKSQTSIEYAMIDLSLKKLGALVNK